MGLPFSRCFLIHKMSAMNVSISNSKSCHELSENSLYGLLHTVGTQPAVNIFVMHPSHPALDTAWPRRRGAAK